MPNLVVDPEDALRRLKSVDDKRIQAAIPNHWVVEPNRILRAKPSCWLFCWAKTGQGRSATAEQVRQHFTDILNVSFDDFDTAIDHQWARNVRYSTRDYDSELDELLDLRHDPDFMPPSPAPRDMTDPPERVKTTLYRILRDTAKARRIKELHEYRCQIPGCELRICLAKDKYYAEAHHLQPLGNPYSGPDDEANIICVCPYHHAELDYGVIAINELRQVDSHTVAQQYIDYHNNKNLWAVALANRVKAAIADGPPRSDRLARMMGIAA